MLMIILVFVNAHFNKKCRNNTSTLYLKFGKNTSVTMQQTRKWQTHVPHCMHLLYAIAAKDIILVKCLSYLCACVESLNWKESSPGPMNVTISRQKTNFVT